MKKLTIIVAAVIVLGCLGLAGASYYTGLQVEKRLPEVLRTAGDRQGIVYTIKEQHRGIFESRYVISFAVPMPAKPGAAAGPLALDMNLRVVHGPIPLGSGSLSPCRAVADATFAVAPDADPSVHEFFTKIPELLQSTLRIRGNFDDTGTLTFVIPPFSRDLDLPQPQQAEPLHVDWKGLTLAMNFAENAPNTGTVEAPGLALKRAKDSLAFEDFSETFSFLWIEGMPHLATVKANAQLKSLDADYPSMNTKFSVTGMTMSESLAPRGPVLDYVVDMKGTRHAANSPDIPASLHIALNSLDAAALNDALGMLQKFNATPQQEPAPEDLVRMGNALLARAPSLDVNITAMEGTPTGPVSLKAEVKTDEMKSLPVNELQALTQLRASGSLNASEKSLLDLLCLVQRADTPALTEEQCQTQTTQQIDQLVTQGQLVRGDGKLTAKAVWDGQHLLLNGNPLQ